jgi:hypothetical protein
MIIHPHEEAAPAEPMRPATYLADGPGRRASRFRVRSNAVLKLVRRMHLFAGLFMTPWVFLYGVTGFLFNHPEAFPDREVRTAGRSDLAGTPLDGFPTAPELADRIVAALNHQAGSGTFRLVDRAEATYSRTLFVTATGRGREHSVRFDPDTGEAFIRSSTLSTTRSIPWPGGTTLPLDDSPRERLSQGVPALLAKLGIEADATTVRNPPDLVCTLDQEGRRWRIAYNIQTGTLSARPADDPDGPLSTRLFLTRLHLAFSYPSRIDARWFWAVAVDAMFVSMVFWGTSGLLMWWQMKKLRGWGALALAVSAVVATAMALGMHQVLASRV